MSEITGILEKLKGTKEAEILERIEASYEKIAAAQKTWYEKSSVLCPSGCGQCCHNFEPDLLSSEALYMAAWLLENQAETAEKVAAGIFPFENGKTCLFHDFNNPYHCTIYGGRAFICRLFGASGAKDKHTEVVWKPCKFYPQNELQKFKPPLAHRQYSQEELLEEFGILPPVMSNFLEEAVSFEPGNAKTRLLREILPDAVRRLKWIAFMNSGNIAS